MYDVDKMTFHIVGNAMLKELEERKDEIFGNEYPEDVLHEIVDSNVPIYHSDLADILSDDNSFAFVDDAGLMPEHPDVYQIISISIYEKLSDIAYLWFEDNKVENEDA
jgi:hypothetical protein